MAKVVLVLHEDTVVVTSSKDGPDSVLERDLPDADVIISQPFWPAYLTAERIAKAPKLKLALTTGIGSDQPQDRRRGRFRDDDPRARAQLYPLLSMGGERRLEHRRLRRPLI